eukprot:g3604.t1
MNQPPLHFANQLKKTEDGVNPSAEILEEIYKSKSIVSPKKRIASSDNLNDTLRSIHGFSSPTPIASDANTNGLQGILSPNFPSSFRINEKSSPPLETSISQGNNSTILVVQEEEEEEEEEVTTENTLAMNESSTKKVYNNFFSNDVEKINDRDYQICDETNDMVGSQQRSELLPFRLSEEQREMIYDVVEKSASSSILKNSSVVFQAVDSNGCDGIDGEQFHVALHSVGIQATVDDARILFDSLQSHKPNREKNTVIGEEFSAIVKEARRYRRSQRRAKSIGLPSPWPRHVERERVGDALTKWMGKTRNNTTASFKSKEGDNDVDINLDGAQLVSPPVLELAHKLSDKSSKLIASLNQSGQTEIDASIVKKILLHLQTMSQALITVVGQKNATTLTLNQKLEPDNNEKNEKEKCDEDESKGPSESHIDMEKDMFILVQRNRELRRKLMQQKSPPLTLQHVCQQLDDERAKVKSAEKAVEVEKEKNRKCMIALRELKKQNDILEGRITHGEAALDHVTHLLEKITSTLGQTSTPENDDNVMPEESAKAFDEEEQIEPELVAISKSSKIETPQNLLKRETIRQKDTRSPFLEALWEEGFQSMAHYEHYLERMASKRQERIFKRQLYQKKHRSEKSKMTASNQRKDSLNPFDDSK